MLCAAIAAKQCRWYNKRHQRKEMLWMDRYKSVQVEGRRERRGVAGASLVVDVLRVMACYIDLNPVRAGLVTNPGSIVGVVTVRR